jgi:hypothetical protein
LANSEWRIGAEGQAIPHSLLAIRHSPLNH